MATTKKQKIPDKLRELFEKPGNETWLTQNIIIPLFKRKGFTTEYSHGPTEINHNADSFAIWGNDENAIAIQVKCRANITSSKINDIKTQKHYEQIANTARIILSESAVTEDEKVINIINDVIKKASKEGIGQEDVTKIINSARKAITHLVTRSNKVIPISKFYWITTGEKQYANSYDLEETEINKWPELRHRVEIWDIHELFNELVNCYPEALTTTSIEYYKRLSQTEAQQGNFTAASFCCYKEMTYYFKTTEDRTAQEGGTDAIERALAHIKEEGSNNPSSYYYRVLKNFYEAWKRLINSSAFKDLRDRLEKSGYYEIDYEEQKDIDKNYSLSHALKDFPISSVSDEKIIDDLRLLTDIQYIIDQLHILHDNFINAPSGLSSLQVMRLLLRTGFPYISKKGNPMNERFERVKKEMSNEHLKDLITKDLKYKDKGYEHCLDRSIDGGCTMCTGTAVSCFALANKNPDEYLPSLNWLNLEKIRDYRWTFIIYDQLDTEPWKHCLHYTSSVLLAFLDSNSFESEIYKENAEKCLDYFFTGNKYSSNEPYDGAFLKEWMIFRNEPKEDVLQYIFSSLLKVYLAYPEKFDLFRKTILKEQLTALMNYIKDYVVDDKESLSVSYSTRENIESFCFASLLQDEEPGFDPDFKFKNLTEEIINIFRNQIERQLLRESRIFDSNIERSRKFLEGWLTYWEAKLFLREKIKNGQLEQNNQVR